MLVQTLLVYELHGLCWCVCRLLLLVCLQASVAGALSRDVIFVRVAPATYSLKAKLVQRYKLVWLVCTAHAPCFFLDTCLAVQLLQDLVDFTQ